MTTGVARAGFDLDLLDGQLAEQELLGILRQMGGQQIEVKWDQKCRETGNLFVAFRQKVRPSGLATTTADMWAFKFDAGSWLMVPVDRLRAQAERAYKDGRRKVGGDHNKYEGVLVPIAWLVPGGNGGVAYRNETQPDQVEEPTPPPDPVQEPPPPAKNGYATPAQKATILRRAPPSQLKDVDLDKLSYDDAALWVESF